MRRVMLLGNGAWSGVPINKRKREHQACWASTELAPRSMHYSTRGSLQLRPDRGQVITVRHAGPGVSVPESGAIWHSPLLPCCYVDFLRIGNTSDYNPMFEQMNLHEAVLITFPGVGNSACAERCVCTTGIVSVAVK